MSSDQPKEAILGIAKYIDYTLLKADATSKDIVTLCKEAEEFGCASVCVNSVNVPKCYEILKDSKVKVCAVVAFPLGAMHSSIKAKEAKWAVSKGASEIDMVINISALKDKKNAVVRRDIAAVKKVIGDKTLKVIIETCLLTDAEKVTACQLAEAAGADFVKTSTGFSTGGATVQDVALMRETVGKNVGVKASGGIKTLKDANAMLSQGATRLGCGQAGAKAIILEEKEV